MTSMSRATERVSMWSRISGTSVYFWQAAASRDPFATMSVALPGVSWEGASARPAIIA